MNDLSFCLLPERGLLRIAGNNRAQFLQGLVSNDIRRVSAETVIYAALLTPQGKFLHDFFVAEFGGALVIDCEAPRRDDLRRRLAMYKLRSEVAIEDISDRWSVAVAFGAGARATTDLRSAPAGFARAFGDGLVYVDPRLARMGLRFVLPADGAEAALRAAGLLPGPVDAYERLRLSNGVPDGSRDLEVEKATLLEHGFDDLNGIDWQKGCFIGQEVTARTRYRGLVKRRLVPVRVIGPLPPPGTPVRLGEREVGEIRSGVEGLALVLLRLDALTADPPGRAALTAAEAAIEPLTPAWLS